MDFEGAAFKKFLADAKEKAQHQLQSMNVGQEFKDVLANLLKIAESVEDLMRSGQGQSADVRVLKAKFEQTKTDLFLANKKVETLQKEFMSSLSDEVIKISKEIKFIQKTCSENLEVVAATKNIQNSIKTLINRVAELSKSPPTP